MSVSKGAPEATARDWMSARRSEVVTPDVDEYNAKLPHSAFRGQTPDEMYFGTGDEIPKQLQDARLAARKSRMEVNRAQSCRVCEDVVAISS